MHTLLSLLVSGVVLVAFAAMFMAAHRSVDGRIAVHAVGLTTAWAAISTEIQCATFTRRPSGRVTTRHSPQWVNFPVFRL